MKYRSILFLLILPFTYLSAQENIKFAYKLDYSFPQNGNYEAAMNFGYHYIPETYSESNKISLLSLPYLMGDLGYTLVDGNKIYHVNQSDLDNNFVLGTQLNPYYDNQTLVEELYQKIELRKLDKPSQTILEYTCHPYQIFISETGEDNLEDSNLIVCIDESNAIDNSSFIFPKQESNPVKGLILSISSTSDSESERVSLSKVSKVKTTIYFDKQNQLKNYQLRMDSIQKVRENEVPVDIAMDTPIDQVDNAYAAAYENNYVSQPKFCNYEGFYQLQFENENGYSVASSFLSNLCSYTYYMKAGEEEKYKSFALKEIKNMKKNLPKTGLVSKKDAQMFYDFLKKDIDDLKKSTQNSSVEQTESYTEPAIDAVAYPADTIAAIGDSVYEEEPYTVDYLSEYKKSTPEESTFAFKSNDSDAVYWKVLPKYCKNLENQIPKFSNQEITKHAKNYAGQICDMYLGEFQSGVWYKGTLDAIRAEELYFINQRENWSKSDQKLVVEFLNSLD